MHHCKWTNQSILSLWPLLRSYSLGSCTCRMPHCAAQPHTASRDPLRPHEIGCMDECKPILTLLLGGFTALYECLTPSLPIQPAGQMDCMEPTHMQTDPQTATQTNTHRSPPPSTHTHAHYITFTLTHCPWLLHAPICHSTDVTLVCQLSSSVWGKKQHKSTNTLFACC